MSNRRKGKHSSMAKDVPAVTGTADRTAEATPLGSSAPSGGSVMNVPDLLTEGSFLKSKGVVFQDSPFGQRYVVKRNRSTTTQDVVVRLQVWSFDVRGYMDTNTGMTDFFNMPVSNVDKLFADWYPLVRDMGKRSLKYKHVPTSLTMTDLLVHYLNAYHYVLANLTALANLNRLAMINGGLSYLSSQLPSYMSRVSRLWRRLSAIPISPLVRTHAIRSGTIFGLDGFTCPVIRFWSPSRLLVYASGGPNVIAINNPMSAVLLSGLSTFVSNLEVVERWLEVGSSTISTDFTAMKDLIDMTRDIVPGTFETGLPDSSSLPGLVESEELYTDVFCRCFGCKDDVSVGTDQWLIFPNLEPVAEWNGKVPLIGRGPATAYDFSLLGSVKVGAISTGKTLKNADVDTNTRLFGTDAQTQNGMAIQTISNNTKGFFGTSSTPYDEALVIGNGTIYDVTRMIDMASMVAYSTFLAKDSSAAKHHWQGIIPAYKESWATEWPRFVEEAHTGKMWWMDPSDLIDNYTTLWSVALGIPYIP